MTLVAINLYNTPRLTTLDVPDKLFGAIKAFLHIYVSHDGLVKILYLIVGRFHAPNLNTKTSKKLALNMRQKHKSNAASFHEAKGGAIPTLTHQSNNKISERTVG